MNMSTITRTAQIKMSSFIFLYFFTWSSSFGLYALWLSQKVGLDSITIGSVFAINGVFAVVMKPVYGYIMDKIGMSKWLLYFVCAVSALMAPFFVFIYQPLLLTHTMVGIVIGALYLSLGWYAGVAASESYADRFSRMYGLEFGRIRMWGSLGWAMAASVSGLLFNYTPLANFLVSSATSVLMLLMLVSLKIGDEQLRSNNVISANKIVFADVLMLLKNRKFWMFSLYVAGVAWMMFVAEQQFPRYFVSFFDTKEQGNAWYGYLSTVQSGMEFVMMMFIPLLVNHYGAKKGLLFCGCVVGARLIASGLTSDPLIISIIKPFYGVEISLLLISVFKYIAEHFDKKINATMYLLGYQAMIYVGSVVVAPPAGYLYDKIGFGQTYLIMGSCALLFTLVSAFTLSRCQSKRDESRNFAPALNTAPAEPVKH
ncbi:major facilitator superfamily sucrose permease [Buttiauxella ferragutiae ATCC 51602]|jgi:OHS family lactose permease-like MFS transporter|uniref:Major facilitator superfamily sucrose permease n=2 Tax=Enterobacteriaceae TaxID=543 RepID=A0ABX2W6P5_9ENTR|nr:MULTISPECIES: oligosaccharide MFS transporter [Buttiauxella]AYN26483.1 MFS transporter [Buttiauxella sp. 3AFRM03]MCE0828670.1 oligosaccharide MFS transporter [Buttiauxella ferragutiae]OAT26609.1 major facilitator superfamily sucrose permease [Buttiauxella ferragutiae ATCC 51602]TDN54763.1 OHS family lactose permease-like MFS transporter [Buttiauxella sp. JUb87]UNK63282.1 oligosaccharide MFS transporter [Buttiauxella ferragutiae]